MRYQTNIDIYGRDMPITVFLCTRCLKEPVWMARYVPSKEEENQRIWSGGINEKGKFINGRKPKPYSRSTPREASPKERVEILRSWLEAVYRVWYSL